MRILHTADWHLGSRLGAHDRKKDQADALASVIELAERFAPDWIVHAGDVFDSTQPGHQTLRQAVDALNALGRVAPVTVIGGNHDSYPLLRALDRFRDWGSKSGRIRFITEPAVIEPIPGLQVQAVPFQTPAEALAWLDVDPDDAHEEYAKRIHAIDQCLAEQAGERRERPEPEVRVYAAHLYVAGARPGRSERQVTVSDDYACAAADADVDYAAYGHIHDAQAVGAGDPPAWYSGSLVQLDFGEAEAKKSTTLVVIEPGGHSDVWQEPHASGRKLVTFRGSVARLRHDAARGGFDNTILRARVESPERIYDLADNVTEGSPNVAIHELTNEVANTLPGPHEDLEYAASEEPPLPELYREWRKSRGAEDREEDHAAVNLLEEALHNIEAPGTSDFGLGELTRKVDALLARLRRARTESAEETHP